METGRLTIGSTLFAAATAWPQRDAILMAGRRADYRQILHEATTCARGLLGLGLRRGSRVGTLMHNCWEAVVLHYATSLIGAVLVPLNARYRIDELRYAVQFADLDGLFTSPHGGEHVDLRQLLKEAFPELADWNSKTPLGLAGAPGCRFVADLADTGQTPWLSAADLAAAAAAVAPEALDAAMALVEADDICVTIFSSGTTSRPKACMLSHSNIVLTGRAFAERFSLTHDDRFWDPLPLYHMSTILPLSACRAVGAAFIGVEHFEPGRALAELENTGATIAYPSFPTLMASMIAHPDYAKHDLSRVRLMLNIGAPDLLRRFAAALPGAKLVSCYGLTEGGGVSCCSEPDDTLDQRVETSGRTMPGTEMRIVDPATLQQLPADQTGEIWLRGFCVFSGYYKDSENTRLAITPEGWLRTNDLGALDADGRLTFRGRLKDMLKIGGENVAAIEIESYLMRHPAVKLAQVVSAPDDHLVEAAAAFLELLPGPSVTPEEIVAFCAGKIASFKIPRHVRFVTEWPMSTTKIQKFRLLDGFVGSPSLDVSAILRRKQPQS